MKLLAHLPGFNALSAEPLPKLEVAPIQQCLVRFKLLNLYKHRLLLKFFPLQRLHQQPNWPIIIMYKQMEDEERRRNLLDKLFI
jgi:hypothetical protein